MRLCSDCKWCMRSPQETFPGEYARCHAPQATRGDTEQSMRANEGQSLVAGAHDQVLIRTWRTNCALSREESFFWARMLRCCGRSAHWFVPAEPKDAA